MRFVGRIGSFVPIMQGHGGGVLVRDGLATDGTIKLSAVTGTKGYRWLEAVDVKERHLEDYIDRSYYEKKVETAIDTINMFTDYEWFVSNDTTA